MLKLYEIILDNDLRDLLHRDHHDHHDLLHHDHHGRHGRHDLLPYEEDQVQKHSYLILIQMKIFQFHI